MLGKTSISALKTLILLAQQDPGVCRSPRRMAEELGESPTYLAKVVRHLVKSGLLEAVKGMKGGVRLVRSPQEITLLAVVEACQGAIIGDYCRSTPTPAGFCSFHQAALELHEAVTGVLGRWTIADLLVKPYLIGGMPGGAKCLMAGGKTAAPQAAGLTQIGGLS